VQVKVIRYIPDSEEMESDLQLIRRDKNKRKKLIISKVNDDDLSSSFFFDLKRQSFCKFNSTLSQVSLSAV